MTIHKKKKIKFNKQSPKLKIQTKIMEKINATQKKI